MYIEGIALEHFSALPQTEINSSKNNVNAMQRLTIFSDDRKNDAATTTSHRKNSIGISKERKVLTSSLIKIWEILMVVLINIYVPMNGILCKLCLNVTQL